MLQCKNFGKNIIDVYSKKYLVFFRIVHENWRSLKSNLKKLRIQIVRKITFMLLCLCHLAGVENDKI